MNWWRNEWLKSEYVWEGEGPGHLRPEERVEEMHRAGDVNSSMYNLNFECFELHPLRFLIVHTYIHIPTSNRPLQNRRPRKEGEPKEISKDADGISCLTRSRISSSVFDRKYFWSVSTRFGRCFWSRENFKFRRSLDLRERNARSPERQGRCGPAKGEVWLNLSSRLQQILFLPLQSKHLLFHYTFSLNFRYVQKDQRWKSLLFSTQTTSSSSSSSLSTGLEPHPPVPHPSLTHPLFKMAVLSQYDYIFAIGTMFAMLDAFNNGANDVSWLELSILHSLCFDHWHNFSFFSLDYSGCQCLGYQCEFAQYQLSLGYDLCNCLRVTWSSYRWVDQIALVFSVLKLTPPLFCQTLSTHSISQSEVSRN